MDTRDIHSTPQLTGDLTAALLVEQKKLYDKYQGIEKLPEIPLHLDPPENQVVIKDFIGRITEELAEAEEYIRRLDYGKGDTKALMEEEIVDALHFFLELILLVGQTPAHSLGIFKVKSRVCERKIEKCFRELHYELNIAKNSLKNKPWKQTQVKTSRITFYMHLKIASEWFGILLYDVLGWNSQQIYHEYMKKHTVNVFRQESSY